MRAAAATCAVSAVLLLFPVALLGGVTSSQVNEAIERGVAFLEKQQRPDGRWVEYESEPGGGTALCILALLRCDRHSTEHESVRRALAWLEKQRDPERTYAS